jgi:hypothetical protein
VFAGSATTQEVTVPDSVPSPVPTEKPDTKKANGAAAVGKACGETGTGTKLPGGRKVAWLVTAMEASTTVVAIDNFIRFIISDLWFGLLL